MAAKQSEDEDVHTKTLVNQADCISQPTVAANNTNFQGKILVKTELKSEPPDLDSKELCLHRNHNQFGITTLGTISICLICSTVFPYSQLDPCNKSHLSSNEHKEKQSALFKQCFYSPYLERTNKIYKHISSNSFIDFSSAVENSTDELNVICFICEHEKPSLSTNHDISAEEILQHLENNNHIRNLQENFGWKCNLSLRGHMMFYKTLFYCSVCEITINCDDCDLIHSAVNHLETKHQEDCISHSFMKETEKKTSQASDCSSGCDVFQVYADPHPIYHDDDSLFFEGHSCNTSESDMSIPQIQEEIQIGEEIQKREEIATNNKPEEYLYLCPECGENIEIVDCDFEMSIQLHYVNHEKVIKVEMVPCTQINYVEHIFPSIEKKVETPDPGLATNLVSKECTENEHQYQEFIKELSIRNAHKNTSNGHTNQENSQTTSVKQKFPNKTNNDSENKSFSDLPHCLPAALHNDFAQINYTEHIFPSIEKKVETPDPGLATNIVSKECTENEHQYQEFIKELSIRNAHKNNGHTNQENNQTTSVKQKFPNKTNNDSQNKFFSDLSDCLPADFHNDLSFVTIKANHFHCELCICSIGAVLNVFDSSFILNSHFSSVYHKNKMDLVAETRDENEIPKIKLSLPNNKTKKKADISSHVTEDKLPDKDKINQTKLDLNVNVLENASSSNNFAAKTYFHKSDLKDEFTLTQQQNGLDDGSSTVSTVKKQVKLLLSDPSHTSHTDSILNKNNSNVTHQTNVSSSSTNKNKEILSTSSKSVKVQKQTADKITNSKIKEEAEVKVIPNSNSLLSPTKINTTCKTDTTKLLDPTISSLITDLFNDPNLKPHQGFFNYTLDNIYCSICSSDFGRNQTDLKDHINGLAHKMQFLSQLKKSLNKSKRSEVKFLLFINGKLYCSICKCYVSTWDSFVGICQEVEAHFKGDIHSAFTGSTKNKSNSSEKLQEILPKNEKATVAAKILVKSLSSSLSPSTSISKGKNKRKVKRILLNDLNHKPCEALVSSPPEVSKLVDINNCNASGSNLENSLNEQCMELKSIKEVKEDLQVQNVKSASSLASNIFASEAAKLPEVSNNGNTNSSSAKVKESIKMDLSLKRLITTAPLVRVNKDFIEKLGEDFNCILCSEFIPYSPQKYVLVRNFNSHFKSAGHIFTVNQISKVENAQKIFKRNLKKTKDYPKSIVTEEVNPIAQSEPKNDFILNPSSSVNKTKKIIRTDRVKVHTNRSSALKKFITKYKFKKGHNVFEKNVCNDISNNYGSQKLHPLLQKLIPEVPLLQENKQYILRRNINFYCTLCCKSISFSTNHHVLAQYFNNHFKGKTHRSLLRTKFSEGEQSQQIPLQSSTKSPSKTMLCQTSYTESKTKSSFCNVLSEGKILFKELYEILVKFKKEEYFFCNQCIKFKKTAPQKSYECSIIQHYLKVHKITKVKSDDSISDIVWINNILKANITFIEVSHGAAACGICCRPVTFSKNNNLLIFNFLLHFQDEKHKLAVKSTKQSNTILSLQAKSKKYKPTLKAYVANDFV